MPYINTIIGVIKIPITTAKMIRGSPIHIMTANPVSIRNPKMTIRAGIKNESNTFFVS